MRLVDFLLGFIADYFSQTELALDTSTTVYNIREDVSKLREDLGSQVRLVGAIPNYPFDKGTLTVD